MGWDLAIRELGVCFGLVTSPLTGIIKTSLRLVRARSLVSRGFLYTHGSLLKSGFLLFFGAL